MACTYILYSAKTNKYYKGSSRENEANARLATHNRGHVKSTKSGTPWKLVYQEHFPDYTSARKKEIFLKSGIGRKWIKDNIVL